MASLRNYTHCFKKNKYQFYTISSRKKKKKKKDRLYFPIDFMKLVLLPWYPNQRKYKKQTTDDIPHEYRC